MTIVEKPVAPNNYKDGRAGERIDLIVIHVTQGNKTATARWFASPKAGVSAHYLVTQEGEVWRFVRETDTAFHAGVYEVDLRSVGIEHEGVGVNYAPNEAQLAASVKLARAICERWGLSPNDATIRPHRVFRATICPADFPMEAYINMVRETAQADRPSPEPANTPVRVFDPRTNEQIGTGTLVGGTDKVYLARLELDLKKP